MKTLASISAVLCIAVVAAIAAPHRNVLTYDQGPAGDAHRAAITMPSRPADFRYGLTGNEWWLAHDRQRPGN